MPWSGPRHLPSRLSASAWRASSWARPSRMVTAQRRIGSRRLRRSRYTLVSSSDVTTRSRIRAAWRCTGRKRQLPLGGGSRPRPWFDGHFGPLEGVAAGLLPKLLQEGAGAPRVRLEVQGRGFAVAQLHERRLLGVRDGREPRIGGRGPVSFDRDGRRTRGPQRVRGQSARRRRRGNLQESATLDCRCLSGRGRAVAVAICATAGVSDALPSVGVVAAHAHPLPASIRPRRLA